jgi:hypothetical protein
MAKKMFLVTCTLLARVPAKVNENADVIIRIYSDKVELGLNSAC